MTSYIQGMAVLVVIAIGAGIIYLIWNWRGKCD